MMTPKENPGGGQPYRGENQIQNNFIKSRPENQDSRQKAPELAEILIDLYQRYPLFFNEPDADDPDLDMESGFGLVGKQEIIL